MSNIIRADDRHWRRVLQRRDPHCHWCGVLTVDPLDVHPLNTPNMATLDHIKNRMQCASTKEHRRETNKVLACLKCNQDRDREWHLSQRPWINEAEKHKHSRRVDSVYAENCTALVMQPPSWDIFSGGT